MNNKREFTMEYGGKKLVLETGRLAKQADGSVLMSCEGTQVLVNVCSAKTVNDGQDFFPLMVDYKEKFYAAGKFLGGYMKREGRPSNQEILLMRMIDRPLRPLFPEGYMHETIVTAQVLSYSENCDPEVLAGLGTAAALEISDIPFQGPLGFCKVGKIDGKLVLNPTRDAWKKSDLELVVAASENALLMVEGEANEVSEAEMQEALVFAHNEIKGFCKFLSDVRAEVGKTKRAFESASANKKCLTKVEDFINEARSCLNISDKLQRRDAIAQLEEKVAQNMKEDPAAYGLEESSSFGKEAYKAVDELLYKMLRNDILKEGKRIGGRKVDEIRNIETEVGILSTPHGSSLFTRGETQVMAVVTMGGKDGEQMNDSIYGVDYSPFYLHYTFPPFSVGEARGYRGVGRREVGHGNLAERALKKVLPPADKCPYTIRLNCEVLESNGSSSMGSVCSGSMALMDAGIALKAPVAGIAMGLVKDGNEFQILSDILGDEDHLGDMDFKVAGTQKGITAIQMDIKITGINEEIYSKALEQARVGRLHILSKMAETVTEHRASFKEGVPVITSVKIPQDKIGALIGPGGKNIKGIQEEFDVKIEVLEDGTCNVLAPSASKGDMVKNLINLQINGPEVGAVYDAKVVTLKDYGAFVDIAPGVSGLVHVSEIADERVSDVSEYVSEGETHKVKVVEVDRFGRVKLSIKAVAPLSKKEK